MLLIESDERGGDETTNASIIYWTGRLNVPTPEHYYPLLYTLGASDQQDALRFEFEAIQFGSVAMRTFSLGLC